MAQLIALVFLVAFCFAVLGWCVLRVAHWDDETSGRP